MYIKNILDCTLLLIDVMRSCIIPVLLLISPSAH